MNPFYSQATPTDPINSFLSAIGGFGPLLIGLGVAVIIFLVAREILCWYWKINECLDVLSDIKDEIAETNKLLKSLWNAPEKHIATVQTITESSHAADSNQSKS